LPSQGDTFGTREATETFFSMTKLFQCPDVRRAWWRCPPTHTASHTHAHTHTRCCRR
jgi:hypothetical protein